MSTAPDFYNLIAIDRGAPAGWRWFSLKAIDSTVIVTGAVCTATYTRGKRKGQTNWAKRDAATERTYAVSPAEIAERQLRWEKETGTCHTCGGGAREWFKWSAVGGNEYRDCRRCKATGKAAA